MSTEVGKAHLLRIQALVDSLCSSGQSYTNAYSGSTKWTQCVLKNKVSGKNGKEIWEEFEEKEWGMDLIKTHSYVLNSQAMFFLARFIFNIKTDIFTFSFNFWYWIIIKLNKSSTDKNI